ncbi:MAG: hypothetical protein WAT66_16210, partial [Actinomycetota bacterium]
FDEALAILEQARSGFESTATLADSLEAQARIAECSLLSGKDKEPLVLVEELLERTQAISGDSGPLAPMLYRLKGIALARLSEREDARAALEKSVEVARARNSLYDVGLALGPLAALASSQRSGENFAAEREAIFARLGVVRVPSDEIGSSLSARPS